MHLEGALAAAVDRRQQDGSRRHLNVLQDKNVDFCSNDYLGFARSEKLAEKIGHGGHGATGSRLVSGTSQLHVDVERELAAFYRAKAALVFNSGYLANLSVLSAVPQKGDFVLYDALVHNSCREGLRLSRANAIAFNHNDCLHLKQQLERLAIEFPNVNKIVVVESVYSMDGDIAPLVEMVAICKAFNASLIVDEAHGVAVTGPKGSGIVCQLGLENDVFCTVYTFGKGMGIHGAVVCGSQVLKEYLINYARPFIYTTSLPPADMLSIRAAHEFSASIHGEEARKQLTLNIQRFRRQVAGSTILPSSLLESSTAIQGVICPGNDRVLEAAATLRSQGFNVVAIRAPTVPIQSERLRIIVHAYNTNEEIDQLVSLIASVLTPRSKI
ncbi:aminotransferase [Thraustotheca clavata]|uniref:Aminotransferase n=1 Tax=Thraustotheca clavata TaxID=74557 RepID=A0A1V9ZC60_9STRA|nr:aminotransferase [Thraustotheca clavata]